MNICKEKSALGALLIQIIAYISEYGAEHRIRQSPGIRVIA